MSVKRKKRYTLSDNTLPPRDERADAMSREAADATVDVFTEPPAAPDEISSSGDGSSTSHGDGPIGQRVGKDGAADGLTAAGGASADEMAADAADSAAATGAQDNDVAADSAAPALGAQENDAPVPAVPPDAAAIDLSELAARPFPTVDGLRATRFQAVVRQSVLDDIRIHGESRPDVEVCGVLVGNIYRDRAGPFALIEANVRGDYAANQNAQVTFTAQTWSHIQDEMEKRHPDQKILGWYHTHPGFGIFLSKMDLFIHENFFNFPWQIALVYDPKSHENGVFIWRKGVAEREPFLVEDDRLIAPAVGAAVWRAATADAQPSVAPALVEQLMQRVRTLEKRARTQNVCMALVVLLALAWPFVLYTIMGPNSLEPIRSSVDPSAHGPAATAANGAPRVRSAWSDNAPTRPAAALGDRPAAGAAESSTVHADPALRRRTAGAGPPASRSADAAGAIPSAIQPINANGPRAVLPSGGFDSADSGRSNGQSDPHGAKVLENDFPNQR